MRYYIIAGEASGDLHGSNLIKALKHKDGFAEVQAWGGDLMSAAGAKLVKHYRDLAFMGFVEVVKNLRTILGNISYCKKDILAFQPDVLILIDYPGFNLRIAKWAKQHDIKVCYYISPQIWAWHTSRVHNIKQIVDRMFVILPFEKDFYKKYDYPVDFVGHPLLDVVKDYQVNPSFNATYQLSDKPIIALLPGSRKQEIRRMLTAMLEMVDEFKDYQFVIAGAPSIPATYYQEILKSTTLQAIPIVDNQTYDLLSISTAALVTSGTATLETALFNIPQVVCYSGNKLSYRIAKKMVKVEYISLVNLVLKRPLVKELIQDDFNKGNLKLALQKVLREEGRLEILKGYGELRNALGNAGAAERVAALIVESNNTVS